MLNYYPCGADTYAYHLLCDNALQKSILDPAKRFWSGDYDFTVVSFIFLISKIYFSKYKRVTIS